MPWAGTLTLNEPALLTVVVIQFAPPSRLYSTVVVSVPKVAVPLLKVTVTVVALLLSPVKLTV